MSSTVAAADIHSSMKKNITKVKRNIAAAAGIAEFASHKCKLSNDQRAMEIRGCALHAYERARYYNTFRKFETAGEIYDNLLRMHIRISGYERDLQEIETAILEEIDETLKLLRRYRGDPAAYANTATTFDIAVLLMKVKTIHDMLIPY